MKEIEENPYSGLPGLLWAHGEKGKAREVFDIIQANGGTLPKGFVYPPSVIEIDKLDTSKLAECPEAGLFREPGTIIPNGSHFPVINGFPSRCTECSLNGKRCYLEYGHSGNHKFTMQEMMQMTDHELEPKNHLIGHQSPPIRHVDPDPAVEVLANRGHELVQMIGKMDREMEEMQTRLDYIKRQRPKLRHEQNRIQETIAILKGLRAKGESNGRVNRS